MKVLIISHNPITTHQNMGKTMLTLFSAFKKEDLCQLYVYPTIPDVDKCNSYYRITDKDVLKSCYRFKVVGKKISKEEILSAKSQLFEKDGDELLYRNTKNKRAYRKILRDLMWKISPWYNRSIKEWLERECPTHIFLAPGEAKFIYDIALKISKEFNLPIIAYECDDYYFTKNKKGLLNKIHQYGLKRKIEKLMAKTSHIIAICDQLKESYSEKFSISATTVMTGANYSIASKPKVIEKIKRITYLGNIRLNRYLSIAEVGKVIDEINMENGTSYYLDVYSREKDENILAAFCDVKSINFRGFVSGKDFDEIFYNSQTLLHVEAFDEESIDRVKYSISTKIADSLASGICLFAYGPESVASIDYLIENDCAIYCTDRQELKDKLQILFNDSETRNRVIVNAINTAKENHDLNIVGNKVRKIIENIYNESFAS